VPRLYFIRHAIATWKQIPPDYAAQIRKRALPTRGAPVSKRLSGDV